MNNKLPSSGDFGNADAMMVVGESRQKHHETNGSGYKPVYNQYSKAGRKRKENADLPDHTMISVDMSQQNPLPFDPNASFDTSIADERNTMKTIGFDQQDSNQHVKRDIATSAMDKSNKDGSALQAPS